MHVTELTQPIGHSTSGSHERYKYKKSLDWERKYDCNLMMRKWILDNGIATVDELSLIENESVKFVKDQKALAWDSFQNQIKTERISLLKSMKMIIDDSKNNSLINLYNELSRIKEPTRKDVLSYSRKCFKNK